MNCPICGNPLDNERLCPRCDWDELATREEEEAEANATE